MSKPIKKFKDPDPTSREAMEAIFSQLNSSGIDGQLADSLESEYWKLADEFYHLRMAFDEVLQKANGKRKKRAPSTDRPSLLYYIQAVVSQVRKGLKESVAINKVVEELVTDKDNLKQAVVRYHKKYDDIVIHYLTLYLKAKTTQNNESEINELALNLAYDLYTFYGRNPLVTHAQTVGNNAAASEITKMWEKYTSDPEAKKDLEKTGLILLKELDERLTNKSK